MTITSDLKLSLFRIRLLDAAAALPNDGPIR